MVSKKKRVRPTVAQLDDLAHRLRSLNEALRGSNDEVERLSEENGRLARAAFQRKLRSDAETEIRGVLTLVRRNAFTLTARYGNDPLCLEARGYFGILDESLSNWLVKYARNLDGNTEEDCQ